MKNTKKTDTKLFWHEIIDKAEKRGEFTLKEKSLSGNWPDCACGTQSEFIDRDEGGEPMDTVLRGLGYDFCDLVGDDDFKGARRTLEKIEKRSSWLLAKQLEKFERGIVAIRKELGIKK